MIYRFCLMLVCLLGLVSALQAQDRGRVDVTTVTLVSGTAQQAVPFKKDRGYLFVQALNGDVWIRFGAAAVTDSPSVKIMANDSFVFEASFQPTQSLSVISSATNAKVTIWEK